MFAYSSTKGQLSPRIITFSDIDQKSDSHSPNIKQLKAKNLPFPSFGMISQNNSMELPVSSSRTIEIILVQCSNNTLILNEDPSIDKLLFNQKMRFIVQISVSRSKSECITIIEKPVLSDSNKCKYYTLRCYVCSDQTPMSFYLLRLSYSISMYFCLMEVNEKIVSFITVSLKNMKPSLWRTNNLYLISGQDGDISTAYQSTVHPPSLYKSGQGQNRHESSPRSVKTINSQRRSHINLRHLMMNHFTNITPISHQSKIISIINQQKFKGLYYQLDDIITLINKINSNTLLLPEFQAQVLKINMQEALKRCKKQYTFLSSNIYNSGKSVQFIKLRSLLSQIYSSTLDSFDRQFLGLQGLQDHDIHRQILKRWIQSKQQQIFEVNSLLHETQTTKSIEISMGEGTQLISNIQSFFSKNQDLKSKDVNIDGLIFFLKTTYMSSLKKKIESIEQNNKRRVIREINYYQNPAQMLKNCEQRFSLSNDKKQYLIKCIELVQKQIQNLDNLEYGLSLEDQRQSIKYRQITEMKHDETLNNKLKLDTQ